MSTGTELSALLATYMHNDADLSAANKLTYLNLATKRILRDAPERFLRKEGTISVTAGVREYNLASDFHQMQSVWDATNGKKVDPMMAGEFVEHIESKPIVQTGTPETYIILGYSEVESAYRIRFDKNPDDSLTVTYWYFPVPVTITAGSTPGLSSMGYDELLIWCAAMIALQPKDPEGHQTAKQNYVENLYMFKAYGPMSPDYTPVQRPVNFQGGSTLTLTEHYPGE